MSKWMLRIGVAGLCCGALSGGDVDAGGGGGGALGSDDQTCVGSYGGGGDCCVVAVGKVVAAPVKRRCRACLLQVVKAQGLVELKRRMVIRKVGSQWLEWSSLGPVLKGPWRMW